MTIGKPVAMRRIFGGAKEEICRGIFSCLKGAVLAGVHPAEKNIGETLSRAFSGKPVAIFRASRNWLLTRRGRAIEVAEGLSNRGRVRKGPVVAASYSM